MSGPYRSIAIVASPNPEAQAAEASLRARYPAAVDIDAADVVVALGGDGMMLRTLHRLKGTAKPVYGMNKGSVGFLMNEFRADGLEERLAEAQVSIVHPLLMEAFHGEERHRAHAINEVSLLRQTHQAAKLTVEVDGKVRLSELISDGVLVATPFGSTAYNLSVNGPILPLAAPLLALTPISAFRPRRWRGALLPDRATITIDVNEPERRPVSATADHTEFRRVARVTVSMDHGIDLVMLHDPGHGLDERILREQFGD